MSDQLMKPEIGLDLTLLSNFIHQVINPLNGVAGTLSNLSDGTIEGVQRREQRLNAARAQLEQCITLIRNLAFFSKGFGKLSTLDERTIVLPQTIIESVMFYQEDGARKGIRIELKERSEQNRVRGHPDLIRQVIMNIVDNCIKYGAENSEIEIHQRIQANTSAAIITVKSQSKLPIVATDIPRLTELGFRGQNARQIVASGTGLGLYICEKLLKDVHGGDFRIQSAPNNSLEFTIKLPHGEAA